MPLLGPDGRPVDPYKWRLGAEIAGATLTGVRQATWDHPAAGINPARLAAILREAEETNPEDYLALAEDMEERDPHYLAVLNTRKRQVAELEITVRPADESKEAMRDADLIREFLDRECLQDELFDMLDAVGKGFSVLEILWSMTARRWFPHTLAWRDPRWFRFDHATRSYLLLRTDEAIEGEQLAPAKFIVHRAQAKSGLPIRGGVARAVAWCWMIKSFAARDWAQFAEIFGQPLRLGKYEPGTSAEDRRILLAAVRNMAADAAAIIPASMSVEFPAPSGDKRGGADIYRDLLNYIDMQVSKAVLGQTTTTDAVSGGHAVAKEHRLVQEDIERSDARQLAATLNRDLIPWIVAFNHGSRSAYPRIIIGRPEHTDLVLLTEAVAKLAPLGLRVDQRELREKLGLSEPDKDAELLAPEQQPKHPTEKAKDAKPQRVAARACPVHGPHGTAIAASEDDDPDAIDASIADILHDEGWELMIEPIAVRLRETLAAAPNLEAARTRLAALAETLPDDKIAEMIARASFAARAAGDGSEDLG